MSYLSPGFIGSGVRKSHLECAWEIIQEYNQLIRNNQDDTKFLKSIDWNHLIWRLIYELSSINCNFSKLNRRVKEIYKSPDYYADEPLFEFDEKPDNSSNPCGSSDSLNDVYISLSAVEALSQLLGMKISKTSMQKTSQRLGWETPDLKGAGNTPDLWSYKRIVICLKKIRPKITWPEVFPKEKIDPITGKMISSS